MARDRHDAWIYVPHGSRDGERKFRWAAYQSAWTAVALCSVATVTESLALNS